MEKNARNLLDVDQPVLTIGRVAQVLKVHQRTLRIYDEQNILVARRSKQNRRLYSLNDLERGKLIQYLTRNLAINLAGVKIIFQLLEKAGIPPEDYMEVAKNMAKLAHIDLKTQQQNVEKLSKRGRKPDNYGADFEPFGKENIEYEEK